jgi:hypothetical protein
VRGALLCGLWAGLEPGLALGGAGFSAREGEMVSRSFAKIFFNMTIETRKPLRTSGLCNHHIPAVGPSREVALDKGVKR